MDYKPFPELFPSPVKMQLIWGNFSKIRENFTLHNFFQKKSTDWRMRKLHILTNPKATIQETIYNCHGTDLSPCRREKDNHCPDNGMRQRHAVSYFSPYPWVMTIRGYLSSIHLITFQKSDLSSRHSILSCKCHSFSF